MQNTYNKKPIIIGVIPARYDSSRFKGKIIADIAGKPMIQRVYEQAKQSKTLDKLIVAVDDLKVKAVVESFGGEAILTDIHHQSGTDRIAEVIESIECDIIVNIQGDQPLIDPIMINETVQPMIDNPEILMSTLKREIEEEEFDDTGVVKVVVDDNNYALYFSRSLIPYPLKNEDVKVYEHVGLYSYTKDFLHILSKLPMGKLEKIESLEQLRVMEKGYKIYVAETKANSIAGISVDTIEDLQNVERIIKSTK
jgi:3-deoxy-manno-octulosonate cytidylyltransferase (CMP-KDO synthetase)